jgi:hypothetical protein
MEKKLGYAADGDAEEGCSAAMQTEENPEEPPPHGPRGS